MTSTRFSWGENMFAVQNSQDINTLPADHGTQWFSDTSPEAVMQRRAEARAKSHGLDALTSQISDNF